ncbi:hypothetical protein KC959_00290 [Candidatus Saccharibacteria bacterium]|nr:hypothetical protein [Candidatus Saccharibacteria bacterium]
MLDSGEVLGKVEAQITRNDPVAKFVFESTAQTVADPELVERARAMHVAAIGTFRHSWADDYSRLWHYQSDALLYGTDNGEAYVWLEGSHLIDYRVPNSREQAAPAIELNQDKVNVSVVVSDQQPSKRSVKENIFYLTQAYGLRRPVAHQRMILAANTEDHNWVNSIVRRITEAQKATSRGSDS